MQKLFGGFLFLIGAGFSAGVNAQNKETITWYSSEFQPYSIHSGSYAGKGFNDLTLKEFAKLLPQYNHKYEVAPTPRIVESLGSEKSSCSIQVLKNPEREKTIYFSNVYSYRLPNSVFTTKSRLPLFKPFLNAAGELKVEEAVASGKIKIGIVNGRTYGNPFTDLITKHTAAFLPVPYNASASPVDVLMKKLENQDDFQGALGYQVEVAFQLKNNHRNVDEFVTFNAAGSNLLPLSVACSKTDTGKAILEAVNKIIPDPFQPQGFVNKFYKEWLDAETVKYYDEQLKVMSKK